MQIQLYITMLRTDGVKVIRRVTCLRFAVIEQGVQTTQKDGTEVLYPYRQPITVIGAMTSAPGPDEEMTEEELEELFGEEE